MYNNYLYEERFICYVENIRNT